MDGHEKPAMVELLGVHAAIFENELCMHCWIQISLTEAEESEAAQKIHKDQAINTLMTTTSQWLNIMLMPVKISKREWQCKQNLEGTKCAKTS